MNRLVLAATISFIMAAPASAAPYQIQLTGAVDTTIKADAFVVDLFDTPQPKIDTLISQGRKVICYFSAGSWENWRPDAGAFPNVVKGSSNGWPGEKWLDIRRTDILGPIMRARLDLAQRKKCWGVDPDNVDGYTNKTGFPLTGAQQKTYNIMLANDAHERGLRVGLKNDVDQIPELVQYFDFATNEQCFQYAECGTLKPFADNGKPVYIIEYQGKTANFCPKAKNQGFFALKKKLSLDSWVQFCPE